MPIDIEDEELDERQQQPSSAEDDEPAATDGVSEAGSLNSYQPAMAMEAQPTDGSDQQQSPQPLGSAVLSGASENSVRPAQSGGTRYQADSSGTVIASPLKTDKPSPPEAASALGEFATATGTSKTAPQARPGVTAPTISPDFAKTQADLRAHASPTPKYGADGKVQSQYHPGIGARIGRAVLDFTQGGIGGVARGALGDRSAPGYFGPGAVNSDYFRDEALRKGTEEADKTKIQSFEDEEKQNHEGFSDQYKVQHDEELSSARKENADTRRDLATARENAIDRNSIFKGNDGQYYGYTLGDTERKNPIKVTPAQQMAAQNRTPQQPKTYEQQVLAWSQETDPNKKANLEKSIQRIEKQRRALHMRSRVKDIPDQNELSANQNRMFKAQMIAEAIPQRRTALQRSLTTVAPKGRQSVQDAIDKLDQRSQQILADVRSKGGAAQGKPGMQGSPYTHFAKDGKGNRQGYNSQTKRWEPIKGDQ